MIVTYGLLALAILSVWLTDVRLSPSLRIPAWGVLLLAAIVSGLASGILAPLALLSIVVFVVLASYAERCGRKPDAQWLARLLLLLTMLAGLVLAMHLAPGFHNPRIIDKLVLSPGGAPFTQYLNFDKGLTGLVLLALFCARAHNWQEFAQAIKRAVPVMAVTLVAVVGTALAIGFVKPDFKLPDITLQFLLVNLLLTCVAEEAFFRGLLQERIAAFLKHTTTGETVALLVASVLFGLTHAAGGWRVILLATMAGLGYGFAYRYTKRIEAAIATHFIVNAVQFLALTYPYLRG
ncbi:CPBP family intramembrane glutamic endopeptidase [Janthinobacterium agaricidamnosum]|uniref:CAAX amino terminal protease family protein n=1 Tax=Janthinobacterium agaricidamnosum NBRC 102515 = DSM 9628 TaxID=1349767 RepID=W0V3T6_9BURK|nr:CPBP family intramembrane glutamic endopeptidase [Janthinobacterium agaricidamnosum]CDG82280.1 CAAX amino terminal protease family protein [Janthinobacterium agaricidamnosum NBRC 102515 = DSM 9628]